MMKAQGIDAGDLSRLAAGWGLGLCPGRKG